MSLKNKFFSGITLGAAVFAFSAIGMAQEATTTTTAPTDKVEKEKGQHRGHGEFGGREFGKRGEFGGKFGRGGHRGMGGRGAMAMFRGIDLTEAQKTQLRAIHEANKPNQETMDEMRTIMAAKRDGTITEDQKARAQAFHEQMKAKHESIKSQIEAILTPEQKQQIETRRLEMKTRMEERRVQREQRKAAQPTGTTTEKPKDN